MKNNDKDDNLGNDSSFLSRWSKRKSESNEVSLKNEQNEKNTVDVKDELTEEENKLSNDELAEKYEVTNPEKIDNPLDLRNILKENIPDRLKQVALRKLWKLVPAYGEISELVEYGEDFTDAATVIENLQTSYIVGKGYIDKVVEKSKDLISDDDNLSQEVKGSNDKASKKQNAKAKNSQSNEEDEKHNKKSDKSIEYEETNRNLEKKPVNQDIISYKEKETISPETDNISKPLKASRMVFVKK